MTTKTPRLSAHLLLGALCAATLGCAADELPGANDERADSLSSHTLRMQPTGSVQITPSNVLPSPRYEGVSTVISHTDDTVTVAGDFLESALPGVFPDRIELVEAHNNLALVVEYRGPDTDWQRLSVQTPSGTADLFKGVILYPAENEVSVRWVIPGLIDASGVENRVHYKMTEGRTSENSAGYQYRVFVTPTWDAWDWDDGQEYEYTVQAKAAGESEWIWGLTDWL